MTALAASTPTSRIVATPIVMAFLGTCTSPKKSLAASTRVTLSRYTARVRVWLADLQGVEKGHVPARSRHIGSNVNWLGFSLLCTG